jgi:geranylgeranyl reductase family protein
VSDADVLVVGGGPAGSTLAALAAAKGARVVLLERERFPRDKVCGEFLSAEGCAVLERLGVLPALEKSGATAMTSCLLADARGRHAASPLPSAGLGITRAVMDELLLRTAAERGASIHEETAVTAPIVDGGRVRGVSTRRGRYRAPIVVATDGRRSVLQRALHPRRGDPLKTTSRSWFGFQAHFPDATNGLGGRIELFVFDGGYAGLGPVEGGRLNLALIATVRTLQRAGGKPDRLLHERMMTNPLLAERLGGLRPVSGWKTVGPLRFGTRRASSSGVLFVGDAAGTVDPFSGEGMSHALLGAEMALPFVLDAAAHGGLDDIAAGEWERTWHRAFAPATRRTRLIGQLFQHAWPASLAMSFLSTGLGSRALPRLVAASRTGVF